MSLFSSVTEAVSKVPPLEAPRAVSAQRIAYGTLDMPRSAQHAFDAAVAYLSTDSIERGLFSAVEHADRAYHLVINSHGDDSYDPNTHTIHWDPTSALRTTSGGTQSPALGLGHEVDHAVFDERAAARLAATYDPQYNNKEERRVITGSEAHAAQTLGEARRYDHGGQIYRVAGPTQR